VDVAALRIAILWAALLFMAPFSWASDRWYEDPSSVQIRYEDLAKPLRQVRVRVTTAVLAEGHRHVDENLQANFLKQVSETLRKSGLVVLSHETDDLRLVFYLDVDPKGASDVERGGPGSRVKWVQELVVFAPSNGIWIEHRYQRSLLVFRGKAREPEGLGLPLESEKAHALAVEAMLLQAMQDLQRGGVLPIASSE
jgi:hypothetical protein